VDQHGQVIDAYASQRRDIAYARRFFGTALADHGEPSEVNPIVRRPWRT
jgi:transposase-like protein